MTQDPFAVQMLTAPLFIGYMIVRFWCPLLADAGCVIAACLLLALTAWLITSLERWIGDHVSAYWRQYRTERSSQQLWREFDQAEHDRPQDDVHDGHTQIMPGVTQLGPTVPLPTLPGHELQRRTRARSIRRRLTRRYSTTSSNRRH